LHARYIRVTDDNFIKRYNDKASFIFRKGKLIYATYKILLDTKTRTNEWFS
jgi:hypothetical protein